MSFPPAAWLWATTMVRDPMFFCDAPWFNPNKVRSFPVAWYLDVDGMFPELCLPTIFYILGDSIVARFLLETWSGCDVVDHGAPGVEGPMERL